ncbi:hypothetical protein CAPTEDRAFT_69653, partial [Capitella teleta]
VEVETPDVMHCNETRYFWISWKNGVIEVGRGLVVGNRVFMVWWKDPEPYKVNGIAISTGFGAEGKWKF